MTRSKERIAKGKSCGNETVTETINIFLPSCIRNICIVDCQLLFQRIRILRDELCFVVHDKFREKIYLMVVL